jgi:dephospho-CoA kinase
VAVKIGKTNITTIGVTGTIGSGKSLAGKMLEDMGIPVIDTDNIVRELLTSDNEIKKQIEAQFPSVIKITTNGEGREIDRGELAKIIFADKEAKTKLEAILHPKVREICKKRTIDLIGTEKKIKAIATLVPLLFESKRRSDYDYVWTIYCDENILRQRLAKRDNFSKNEIDLRLAGQLSQAEKCKLADKVLDNSTDENYLRQQIFQNLQDLKLSSPDLK